MPAAKCPELVGSQHPGGDGSEAIAVSASPIAPCRPPRQVQTGLRDWLAVARITRNPAGHLVMDMKADGELPALRSLAGLIRYLERHAACYGALQAAPVAWRRYRRWCS